MLTLILKSLENCNLRCAYCSVGDKTRGKTISAEKMLEALRWFSAYAQQKKENEVTVIFHGGEPMLLPPNLYRGCITTIKEEAPQLQWNFSMQSNGTLLTKEYLQMIHECDIHVGISLDGSQVLHDYYRRDSRNQPTYSRILSNIEKLQQQGHEVSVLMVLTKPAFHMGFEYLKELERRNLSLKINPLYSAGEAVKHPELGLHPGEYADYLIQVFHYIMQNDLALDVSPLTQWISAVINRTRPWGCSYSPQCSETFICVDDKGDIYPCGRFCDQKLWRLGNITEGITEEGKRRQNTLKARRNQKLPDKCKKCPICHFCYAGCTADVILYNEGNRPGILCKDYKKLAKFLYKEGIPLIRKRLNLEKEYLQEQERMIRKKLQN